MLTGYLDRKLMDFHAEVSENFWQKFDKIISFKRIKIKVENKIEFMILFIL